ncbi:hypothetical protein Glo7428_4293 [Gloeocapsa sp. PCC 7428]|nr:hypothetical protein Glo7428_4293 [Gloeocapsa sp. PCC 7428]
MTQLILLFLNLLLIFPNPSLTATTPSMLNLQSYQWKNRLLLVSAPSENTSEYQQQMQLFSNQTAEFADRDLLLIELFANGTSRINGNTISSEDVTQIKQQFNIGNEFSVILVGKDGTAKRRETTPVEPTAIFQQIDAMPMRQQEMRSQ